MEVKDLFVPKDKFPMAFLSEQGERIKNSWIFLHESVIQNLRESNGVTDGEGLNCLLMTWKATKEYPETKLAYDSFDGTGWYIIIGIVADDIAYDELHHVREPESIFRLKMAP